MATTRSDLGAATAALKARVSMTVPAFEMDDLLSMDDKMHLTTVWRNAISARINDMFSKMFSNVVSEPDYADYLERIRIQLDSRNTL